MRSVVVGIVGLGLVAWACTPDDTDSDFATAEPAPVTAQASAAVGQATAAKPAAPPAPAAAPAPAPSATAVASAQPSAAAAAPPAAAPAGSGPTVELAIGSVGNTMAFDLKTMTVGAGQRVHLALKNNGTLDVMPHNWVLVKPGTEAAVAAAGLTAGQGKGYLELPSENVLASTPLATKGATVEVTFTAPSTPGDYPYICTVPGHYMVMKGVLKVTP